MREKKGGQKRNKRKERKWRNEGKGRRREERRGLKQRNFEFFR